MRYRRTIVLLNLKNILTGRISGFYLFLFAKSILLMTCEQNSRTCLEHLSGLKHLLFFSRLSFQWIANKKKMPSILEHFMFCLNPHISNPAASPPTTQHTQHHTTPTTTFPLFFFLQRKEIRKLLQLWGSTLTLIGQQICCGGTYQPEVEPTTSIKEGRTNRMIHISIYFIKFLVILHVQ